MKTRRHLRIVPRDADTRLRQQYERDVADLLDTIFGVKSQDSAERIYLDDLASFLARAETKLRRAHDAGDAIALVEALIYPLVRPGGPVGSGRERSEPREVMVPTWAFKVAVGYVLRGIGAAWPADLPRPPAVSPSPTFGQRYGHELADLAAFIRVRRLQYPAAEIDPLRPMVVPAGARSATLEAACATLAEQTGASEETIRHAYQRARRRLTADPDRYAILGEIGAAAARRTPAK